MLDSKVFKQCRVIILRSQAGISQIARNIRPILKTPFGKIDIRDRLTYYSGKNFAVCSAV